MKVLKIKKGTDLPDDLIRTVILVGIPYPPVTDKLVESKVFYAIIEKLYGFEF